MPTGTLIFLAVVLTAFGAFAATFIGVDLYTRDVRAKHPQPGE